MDRGGVSEITPVRGAEKGERTYQTDRNSERGENGGGGEGSRRRGGEKYARAPHHLQKWTGGRTGIATWKRVM